MTSEPFPKRDKWELLLRLCDCWIVMVLVDTAGACLGCLKTVVVPIVKNGHQSGTRDIYQNQWGAISLLLLALGAGYLAYRVGLSSRLFLRQALLFKERENFRSLALTAERWVERESFDNLREPSEITYWKPVSIGLFWFLVAGDRSHILALLLALFFGGIVYARFPARVIDLDKRDAYFAQLCKLWRPALV